MRIFYGPVNVAGILSEYAKAVNKLGHEADVVAFRRHSFDYHVDVDLNLKTSKWLKNWFAMGKLFWHCVFNYDVFHFAHGMTLLPRHIDLPILKLLGKKILMHFTGCEMRIKHSELARREEFIVCKECKKECDDREKEKNFALLSKYVDFFLGGADPSYYANFPPRRFNSDIKLCIDLELWKPNEVSRKTCPVIIHAPSNPHIKGTKYVLEAVEKLKKEYDFEFKLLRNVPNNRVKEFIQDADIVVDQLLIGWYGTFAVESMALGKPVLCYLRADCLSFKPNVPIVNTNAHTVYENLKRLIEDPELRITIGRKSRKYVEEEHDSLKIGRMLVDLYESLLQGAE